MRIIAGHAKGRKLFVSAGKGVRPTADRVREALFSSLGNAVVQARTLDLFAGSGALGLEALSRGAVLAVFVERSGRVQDVLRRNIRELGFESRSRVVCKEALAALKSLIKAGAVFDLVFLDPPYWGDLLEKSLDALANSELPSPDALIVAEHPRGKDPKIPQGFTAVSTKNYGTTSITTIKKAGSIRPQSKKEDEK